MALLIGVAMRLILFLMVGFVWPFGTFNSISQNNRARKEADAAFRQANYGRAVDLYSFLVRQPAQLDPALWLNLGHAYFALGKLNKANQAYARFDPGSTEPTLSVAYVQRAVIACSRRDTASAIQLLQQALLIDAANEAARYDYELLKKRFSGRQPPQSKSRAKAADKPQARPDSSSLEVARSPRQEQILQRLRTMNMTEEQADQLLNAMRDDDLPIELARRRNAQGRQSGSASRW